MWATFSVWSHGNILVLEATWRNPENDLVVTVTDWGALHQWSKFLFLNFSPHFIKFSGILMSDTYLLKNWWYSCEIWLLKVVLRSFEVWQLKVMRHWSSCEVRLPKILWSCKMIIRLDCWSLCEDDVRIILGWTFEGNMTEHWGSCEIELYWRLCDDCGKLNQWKSCERR